MEKNTTVQVDGDILRIENLEIEDANATDYLEQEDNISKPETVQLALRVGFETLRVSETTTEMEYVRNEFESLSREFENHIEEVGENLDEVFDSEDGEFSEIVDETFGEDGHVVNEVLDPDDDATPIGKLREDIEAEFEKIREKLIERDARKEVEERTRIKGENFEDDLEELLSGVTQKSDELKRTGEDHGELTDRFVGDFVVTLGETSQDIVIEAKNVSSIGKPEIKRQIEQGIENRDADYGILVLQNEDAASDFLGAFREFDQEILYVAISDSDTESYDERLLNLAYEWARMRTLSAEVEPEGEDVDIEFLQNKMAEISDSIDSFQQVRTKCSNIETARKGIENEIDSIEDDIEQEIDEVEAEIREVL